MKTCVCDLSVMIGSQSKVLDAVGPGINVVFKTLFLFLWGANVASKVRMPLDKLEVKTEECRFSHGLIVRGDNQDAFEWFGVVAIARAKYPEFIHGIIHV